jgi:predicted nuclease of predicted toxin-antitoxin system
MRFFLDAGMPRSAIDAIAQSGHEPEFSRDIGLASASDSQIAAHAKSTGAVLVTRDLDFADIRRYPPDEYHGILVLRLHDQAVASEFAFVLKQFLSEPSFVAALPGRLAIVELDRARFRPPLH